MRTTKTLLASALFSLALSAPAFAHAASGSDQPSCGEGKDGKGDKKEKNPSLAEPQCGGGEKTEKPKPEKPSA
jgi:hypothetical protein